MSKQRVPGGRTAKRKSYSPGSRPRSARTDIQGLRQTYTPEGVSLSTPDTANRAAGDYLSRYQSRHPEIALHLSEARLGPYRAAVGDSLHDALRLYAWNSEMSSALFEQIHYAEVVLRNALHDQLSAFCRDKHGEDDWLRRLDEIDETERRDISEAEQSLETRKKPVNPSGIVSQLSLGFWKSLLTRRYHSRLWEPALRFAFPNLPGAIDHRSDVYDQVRELCSLRNRIAHHEPIHANNHEGHQTNILILIGWISMDTRDWVETLSRIRDVVPRKPSPGHK